MLENVNGVDCKKCNKCHRILPVVNFHKDSTVKDGYKGACKQCRKGDVLDTYKKVVVLPDIHVPYNISLVCIEKFLADYRPDIIIWLGDTLDLDYMSKYTTENTLITGEKYKPECDTVAEMLSRHMTLSGASEGYYLEGNHEYRAVKYLEKNPAGMGTLEVPNMLKLSDKGIKWIPMNKLVPIGKISFTHGTYYSKFHADKHVLNYGRNIMYGHTHNIQTFSGIRPYDVQLPHVAKSIGCLCTINPTYMKNRPNAWINAFAIVEIEADGTYTDTVVHIVQNSFRIPGMQVRYS
jgi:predicted phosphodiesterase